MESYEKVADASEQPIVHTPEPWFVDRNHSGKIIGVASPSRKHDLDFVCGFSSPTNEADAVLIAAAPELLRALREIADHPGMWSGWAIATRALEDTGLLVV